MAADLTGRDSHFIFSLHVYQYSVENNKKGGGCGVIGGRSRLHLIDFGCCDRTKTSGGNITLSGLGNVILGIFNGQRHLPFKVKNFIVDILFHTYVWPFSMSLSWKMFGQSKKIWQFKIKVKKSLRSFKIIKKYFYVVKSISKSQIVAGACRQGRR